MAGLCLILIPQNLLFDDIFTIIFLLWGRDWSRLAMIQIHGQKGYWVNLTSTSFQVEIISPQVRLDGIEHGLVNILVILCFWDDFNGVIFTSFMFFSYDFQLSLDYVVGDKCESSIYVFSIACHMSSYGLQNDELPLGPS